MGLQLSLLVGSTSVAAVRLEVIMVDQSIADIECVVNACRHFIYLCVAWHLRVIALLEVIVGLCWGSRSRMGGLHLTYLLDGVEPAPCGPSCR